MDACENSSFAAWAVGTPRLVDPLFELVAIWHLSPYKPMSPLLAVWYCRILCTMLII